MADEITPALTLDPTSPRVPFTVRELDAVDAVAEWLAFGDTMLSRPASQGHGEWCFAQTEAVMRAAERGDLHAAAALALFQQPFGFTWQDVRALEILRGTFERMAGILGRDVATAVGAARILEAKLAALLPNE